MILSCWKTNVVLFLCSFIEFSVDWTKLSLANLKIDLSQFGRQQDPKQSDYYYGIEGLAPLARHHKTQLPLALFLDPPIHGLIFTWKLEG
jgi:hypothetical protein